MIITALWIKFYVTMQLTFLICLLVRVYWFAFPYRRPDKEKLERFCDVVSLMALTIVLGDWFGLSGWGFYGALAILGLMYWSENRRKGVRSVLVE